MQRILPLILTTLVLLTGCQSKSTSTQVIRVGTIAGPETELMEVANTVAERDFKTTLKIVQFSDYVMPNVALNDKSIDANVYQHQPYLEAAMLQHKYPFVSIGKTFIYPMALYSQKIKKLDELQDKAIIAIPNDPSNGARALLLLNKAGLIKLKEGAGINATVHDIAYNPKNFEIKELDAAQLPRALADVTLAVINTNYALPAGLLPKRDGLFVESTDSPYANLIVVREDTKTDPKFKILLSALQSSEVSEKAKDLFQGQAVSAW